MSRWVRRRRDLLDRQRHHELRVTAERIAIATDHRAAVAHDLPRELERRALGLGERDVARGQRDGLDRDATALALRSWFG
jgi:hypothetical protein